MTMTLAEAQKTSANTFSATPSNYNDTAWSLMYQALVQGLGVQPSNFQLIYPFTSWNWPVTNIGYTSAAQYNLCSTIPQWSAVGQYASSGTTFNSAYQQFLNVILPNTTNPTLQQQLTAANNQLTLDTNNYQTTLMQAQAAYNSSVTNNTPTFTDWLGSFAGAMWQTQLTNASATVANDQKVYNALLLQQTTPGLAQAQTDVNNQAYYTKLQDPSLSSFPAVPAWSVSITPTAWVTQVQGGGGTGGNIKFSNSDSAYNYSNSWAKGSTSVGNPFWSVYASGSWQQINEFQSDQQLSVSISFPAWDTIPLQAGPWYNGAVVNSLRNGPYMQGYSAYADNAGTYMFGQGGVIPLLKTALIVAYQPTFTISVSQATFNSYSQTFQAAAGIRIGPFQFGGSGGNTVSNWAAHSSLSTFTGTSTSTTPLIIGCTVKTMP